MKKISSALIFLFIICMLLACGKKDSENNINDSNNVSATANTQSAMKVDLTKEENVYVIIEGVKYYLSDKYTVQDFVDAGYLIDERLDLNGIYDRSDDFYGDASFYVKMSKEGEHYPLFQVELDIGFDEKILKDIVVSGIELNLRSGYSEGTGVMGDLKYKSSIDEVRDVFGEPSTSNNIMLMYTTNLSVGGYYRFDFDSVDHYLTAVKVMWFDD